MSNHWIFFFWEVSRKCDRLFACINFGKFNAAEVIFFTETIFQFSLENPFFGSSGRKFLFSVMMASSPVIWCTCGLTIGLFKSELENL